MKKISKIISILCLIILIIMAIVFIKSKPTNEIYKEESKENKFLTLMLEKEAGSGKYEESNNNTFSNDGYYFNETLSKCENGSKIKYNAKDKTIDVYSTKADKCYAYFDKDVLGSICRGQNIAECFAKNYNKDATLYYHNQNLTGGAEDNSYRFAGASDAVNNFVCLDGDATSEGACGNGDDDLYRIIGLFKNDANLYEVKLIKYDYTTSAQLGTNGAYKRLYGEGSYPYSNYGKYYKGTEERFNSFGGYFWSYEGYLINEWADSELRTINLNDYYLNTYLGKERGINTDKLIVTHTWQLNGSDNREMPPKEMLDNEMEKIEKEQKYPIVTKTVKDKIGLMYASDYGYAASPSSTSNYTILEYNYNNQTVQDNNWMYMGLYEWTISRNSNSRGTAFLISHIGRLTNGSLNDSTSSDVMTSFAVRPTFYLSADVKIINGNGSKASPYRITV